MKFGIKISYGALHLECRYKQQEIFLNSKLGEKRDETWKRKYWDIIQNCIAYGLKNSMSI